MTKEKEYDQNQRLNNLEQCMSFQKDILEKLTELTAQQIISQAQCATCLAQIGKVFDKIPLNANNLMIKWLVAAVIGTALGNKGFEIILKMLAGH